MGRKKKFLTPESLRAIENMKIELWTGTQCRYIMFFYIVQVVAAVMLTIGMLTDGWYSYEAEVEHGSAVCARDYQVLFKT